MLLKNVCTPEVVCCSRELGVREAARLMRSRHVGALVVLAGPEEDRVPLGVVTDRDLAIEVLGDGGDPAATTLGSLMHRPVVIAHEDEDTSVVIERMRAQGVRRIPVVNAHGVTVGIITLDDLLRVLVNEASSLLELMSRGEDLERRSRRS
jgi:CBS domain-containing protein